MNAAAKDVAPPGRLERTEPYLRPHQIRDLAEERNSMDNTLKAPPYIRNQVQDLPAMVKRIKAIDRQLHQDTATPYPEAEIDNAVRRESSLREKYTAGMPTQAEMRRTPAGAIDKHRRWEAEQKRNVLEWKNVILRLHAGGMIDRHPDAREVANIEQFRPKSAAHELNMDNMLIPGKNIHLPPGTPTIRNVMDPVAAAEAAIDKEIIARLLRENPDTTIAEFRDLMCTVGLNPPPLEEPEPPETTKPGMRKKK